MINKDFIIFAGITLLFGSFLVFAWVFTSAYINESKTTIIDINKYGEAKSEMFIVMPLVFITGLFAIKYSFKNYWRSE